MRKSERMSVKQEFFGKVDGERDTFHRRVPLCANDVEIKLICPAKAVRTDVVMIRDHVPHITFDDRVRAADTQIPLVALLLETVRHIHRHIADLCLIGSL